MKFGDFEIDLPTLVVLGVVIIGIINSVGGVMCK